MTDAAARAAVSVQPKVERGDAPADSGLPHRSVIAGSARRTGQTLPGLQKFLVIGQRHQPVQRVRCELLPVGERRGELLVGQLGADRTRAQVSHELRRDRRRLEVWPPVQLRSRARALDPEVVVLQQVPLQQLFGTSQ